MNQVLRIDNTDPRIRYTPWSGYREIVPPFKDSLYSFFFLFRGTLHTQWAQNPLHPLMITDTIIPVGTKVKFYGHLSGVGGSMVVKLDGNETVLLNNTDLADRLTPIFSSGDLEDGDHEFDVHMTLGSENGNRTMVVDYFECVAISARSILSHE